MPSLRQLLVDQTNDYTELERLYRQITGTELIETRIQAFGRRSPITKSATVLIGTYNSAFTLEKTLISLEASTFNRKYPGRLQVVVVDDGSTDWTRDLARLPLDLDLVYVRQAHAGLTCAHNTGLAFASGDILIFSDSDMVHTPSAIEEMMKRHEVLDNVLLLGFRFEIQPDDPRISSDRLRQTLPHLPRTFHSDFRLSFPAWPSNVCRDTSHLKKLGHGRSIRMANGASYDLPSMVVGAFMSLRRDHYVAMGGSDERLAGWGCEDSMIGAMSIALGNFIVPVYSAASGHVTHPRRTSNEAAEFRANLATTARIRDQPFTCREAPLGAYRARALEVVEHKPSRLERDIEVLDLEPRPPFPDRAEECAEVGLHRYAVGDYEEATRWYARARNLAPAVTWYHLGGAKALRELRRMDESFAAFSDALTTDPGNCWAAFELGLTQASVADYAAAHQMLRRARQLAPGVFDFEWVFQTSSEQHKLRGNCHSDQGFHTLAVRDFELALAVDDTNCWAHYDRGTSLEALGRCEDALQSYLRTDLLLHPQDGNRSWLRFRLNRLYAELGYADHE